MLQKWFKFRAGKDHKDRPEAPDYEQCKAILLKGTDTEKVDLAKSQGVQPEILYFLSSDKNWRVRYAVAQNPDTPMQADKNLATDNEVRVRLALSEKVAQLLPELRPEQNEKITEMAFEILKTLASDQDKDVRSALANSVSKLGTVPKHIALTLAEDPEDSVAVPILEFSDLLDDDDLVSLIRGGLEKARLGAVARRSNLNGPVTEAIVETDELTAISELLTNETAKISDSAFDTLMDGSKHAPSLLEMIAVREAVTQKTLLKLARMASGALLKKLKAREDLGAELEEEIDGQLERDGSSEAENGAKPEGDSIEDLVERMHQDGLLDAKCVMDAVRKGDHDFVSVAMAKIAGVPAAEVRKVFAMESAKPVLTLAWRCEFSIQDAIILQRDVAKIPTSKQLGNSKSNEYPLSEDDLLWQSDLLFSS